MVEFWSDNSSPKIQNYLFSQEVRFPDAKFISSDVCLVLWFNIHYIKSNCDTNSNEPVIFSKVFEIQDRCSSGQFLFPVSNVVYYACLTGRCLISDCFPFVFHVHMESVSPTMCPILDLLNPCDTTKMFCWQFVYSSKQCFWHLIHLQNVSILLPINTREFL